MVFPLVCERETERWGKTPCRYQKERGRENVCVCVREGEERESVRGREGESEREGRDRVAIQVVIRQAKQIVLLVRAPELEPPVSGRRV